MSLSFSANTNNSVELTPWDLFICVAGRPEGIALTRLAHVLQVEKERTLIRPMGELANADLIIDHGDRYSLAPTKRAQKLKETLDYALAYGYDYNAFLSEAMKDFLTSTYACAEYDYFTEYDITKEKLYPEIIARLIRNKLLMVYQFKPFMGKLVQNPFLDGLCEFLQLKKKTPFFSLGSLLTRKKKSIEPEIKKKLSKDSEDQKEQIAAAKRLLGDELLGRDFTKLPENIIALKQSVMHEDTESFDEASSGCYRRACDLMHENVKNKQRLTIEVVQQYHSICMETTDLGGKLRDFEVVIRNNPHFKTAPYPKVPELLDELLTSIYQVECQDVFMMLELTSYFYNQFIYIHPFEDGNSRLARILLAHLLNELGLPFEEIPSSYEVRFLMATKGYRKRDDSVLKEMFNEIYLNYLNIQEMEQAKLLKKEDLPKAKQYNYDHYGMRKR